MGEQLHIRTSVPRTAASSLSPRCVAPPSLVRKATWEGTRSRGGVVNKRSHPRDSRGLQEDGSNSHSEWQWAGLGGLLAHMEKMWMACR